MDINDINEQAVDHIYLIPGECDGEQCLVWCDDPAPGEGMDPSEAVEYVRKDVHDARIAELEAQVEQHKAAEEMQIALREKLEANQERNERLAQVEAMRHVANWLSGAIEEGCIGLDLGCEISGPTGCSDADRCRVAGE